MSNVKISIKELVNVDYYVMLEFGCWRRKSTKNRNIDMKFSSWKKDQTMQVKVEIHFSTVAFISISCSY